MQLMRSGIFQLLLLQVGSQVPSCTAQTHMYTLQEWYAISSLIPDKIWACRQQLDHSVGAMAYPSASEATSDVWLVKLSSLHAQGCQ